MSKTLVAYFSASGTTKKLANNMARVLEADIYEITPAILYTRQDLDCMNKRSRSSLEYADTSSRPALANHDAKIENYDTILVGFPIWWYKAPMIINTFLEAYDFSNKKVILFATSGSSAMGNTASYLKNSVSNTCDLKEGKVLSSSSSDTTILEFFKEI